MKLIIDIPEEQYITLNAKTQEDVVAVIDNKVIATAVKAGTIIEECEDAISRQAVLDLPRIKTHNHWGNVIKESVDVEDVRQLSPVTAEKVGKWKRISMDKYSEHAKYWYRCDRCGEDNLGNTNYCPNCGAKMQEVEE